jgi:hypothetical protein
MRDARGKGGAVVVRGKQVRWLEGALEPAFEQARATRKLVFLDAYHPG